MHNDLVVRGLARVYRGRLIPIIRGGDGNELAFPILPEDLAALTVEELTALEGEYASLINEAAANPAEYVTDDRPSEMLLEQMTDAVEDLKAVRAEIATREPDVDLAARMAELAEEVRVDDAPEPEATPEVEAAATEPEPEPEPEMEPEAETEPEAAEAETVTAAATVQSPAPPPVRPRRATPAPSQPRVALTAAGESGLPFGTAFTDELDIAAAMIKRRSQFGHIAPGTSGEKLTIAQANWAEQYPEDRRLTGKDISTTMSLIAAATRQSDILAELNKRKRMDENAPNALVASGGLCAPVTPYYNLQMLSTADRPVRAALPSFNADRGGIRSARPASLAAITTGIGAKTVEEDAAGGTEAEKSCQVIDCPPFEETDVVMRYHCLQFGNLGARAFPELVAQWNQLTLAAHARSAESALLTGIDVSSTQIEAGDLGLGATAALLPQILAAANGLRNRHRMNPQTVLRLILPYWAVDLMVSDVIRSQFQRFDTDAQRITALLRQFNVEPTFHLDGAAGRGQVFGTQAAGDLLPFPDDVVWYLFPEGSFLFLDMGTLELGLVRDHILNNTNDFQLWGETFENVHFLGLESYAVRSPVCDSGTVSAPFAVTCPIDYSVES